MFEQLSENLEGVFARLRGRGVLTEADIKEGLREVRRVLLEADVNFQLTREFLEHVEQKAQGVAQLRAVSPGQQLVKIVYDELTAMLGQQREGLKLSSVPPTVVMLVGLQGSGKTTTAAKLALKLQKESRPTRLVACAQEEEVPWHAREHSREILAAGGAVGRIDIVLAQHGRGHIVNDRGWLGRVHGWVNPTCNRHLRRGPQRYSNAAGYLGDPAVQQLARLF